MIALTVELPSEGFEKNAIVNVTCDRDRAVADIYCLSVLRTCGLILHVKHPAKRSSNRIYVHAESDVRPIRPSFKLQGRIIRERHFSVVLRRRRELRGFRSFRLWSQCPV